MMYHLGPLLEKSFWGDKMKIGIFGGSFNPPHKMHEKMARELIEKKFLDRVIFVPTGNKYQKKELIEGEKRFEMLKIIASKYPFFKVSDFELKNELTYTFQTLEHFKTEFPNDEIYFILGADNLADIYNWKNYEYLLEHYHFLVINRGNAKTELMRKFKKYENHIEFVPIEQDELSSTQIRYFLKNHNKKALLELDSEVADYIFKHRLYE